MEFWYVIGGNSTMVALFPIRIPVAKQPFLLKETRSLVTQFQVPGFTGVVKIQCENHAFHQAKGDPRVLLLIKSNQCLSIAWYFKSPNWIAWQSGYLATIRAVIKETLGFIHIISYSFRIQHCCLKKGKRFEERSARFPAFVVYLSRWDLFRLAPKVNFWRGGSVEFCWMVGLGGDLFLRILRVKWCEMAGSSSKCLPKEGLSNSLVRCTKLSLRSAFKVNKVR